MKIPSFRRVFQQDYPKDFQGLVSQLAVTINQGFETLFQLANNGITLGDNVSCSVNTFTVVVDSGGVPTVKTTVALTTDPSRPTRQVFVGKVVNNTVSTAYPTGAVFATWTTDGKNLVIQNLTGLTAENSYTITISCFN